MKRLITVLAAMVVAVAMSSMASAQKHGGGKPATTGLEHAETKANPHGDRGIENAETKQAQHKDSGKNKGKGKAKGKQKKHKHSH